MARTGSGSGGGGGSVTNVTASLPLTSSGGTTPNIAINQPAANYIWYSDGSGNLTGDVRHTINPNNGNTDLVAISGGSSGYAHINASGTNIGQSGIGYNRDLLIDSNQWQFRDITNSLTARMRINFVAGGNHSYYLGIGAGNVAESGFGNNTGFGTSVLAAITTGVHNTALGYQAGISNTSGLDNTYVGDNAGRNNSSGYSGTFIGSSAGFTSGGTINNVYVGAFSGQRVNGNDNVAIGTSAMVGAVGSGTTRNVVVGNFAGQSLTSNGSNVLIGFNAGNGLTGGNAVIIGYEAGLASSAAFSNVFIGYQSGKLTTSGANNMFLGALSGQDNVTGSANVFMGDNSGALNAAGSDNILLGSGSTNSADSSNSIGIGSGVVIAESNQLLFGSATHPIYSAAMGDYSNQQNNTWVEVNDNVGIIGLHGGQIIKRRSTPDAAVVIDLLQYIHVGTGLTVDRIYSLPVIGGATGEAPEGTVFIITNKNNSVANIILTPNGADTINGTASVSLTPGDSIMVVSDGVSDWEVI